MIRGIRGAITVELNTRKAILDATGELLAEMSGQNNLETPDIASIIFSVTEDLNAAFPAEAARKLGWLGTPLLCTVEIAVPGSIAKCVRVLMQVNTEKKQSEIKSVYLKGAKKLRPSFGGQG